MFHAGEPVNTRKRQLLIPAATSSALNIHHGLAGGDQAGGPRPSESRECPHQGGATVSGLAPECVLAQTDPETEGPGLAGPRFRESDRAADDRDLRVRGDSSPGPPTFERASRFGKGVREIPAGDAKRQGACPSVVNRGPRADDAHVVARHVRKGESEDAGGSSQTREPATLQARQPLSHRVHLGDSRAAPEQESRDCLLLCQGDAVYGRRHQGGSASRKEEQHDIAGAGLREELDHVAGRAKAPGIGHRMSGHEVPGSRQPWS